MTERVRPAAWLLAAALLALALAVPAARAATTVQTVQGKVFYRADVEGDTAHFNELVVASAEPGSVVALFCEHCPDRGKRRKVPPSGLVSFKAFAATGATAATVQIFDPEGRTLSLLFDHQRGSLKFRLFWDCFLPGSNDSVSCTTKCPAEGQPLPPASPCVNAYQRPRIAAAGETDLINYGAAGSVFERLALTKMPPGSSVLAVCYLPGARNLVGNCPFYVKALAPRARRVDIARALRHVRLRPRTVLDVWLVKSNEIGDVLRFTIRRNRLPSVRKLCATPAETAARRCP